MVQVDARLGPVVDGPLRYEARTFPLAEAAHLFVLSDGEALEAGDPGLRAQVVATPLDGNAVEAPSAAPGSIRVTFGRPGHLPLDRSFASYAAMRAAEPWRLALDR